MSHKRLVFTWQKNFQEVIHPQIFFVIYLYLDASAKRIFKQKNSLADLMHSHISKSDHSAKGSQSALKGAHGGPHGPRGGPSGPTGTQMGPKGPKVH